MSTSATSAGSITMPAVPLAVSDRCDRCGAQAFVRATILVRETEKLVALTFCAHHYAKHQDRLDPVAAHVQDDRHTINTAASASSA